MSVASEQQSIQSGGNQARIANILTGLLAWAGVFVAGVLTYSHYAEKDVPCGPGGGCATVTSSEYSVIFNIPVAIIGLVAYLALAALSTLRPILGKPKWRKLTNLSLGMTGFGFLASIYFIFTSLSVIHATCLWCISSASIMTISLIVTGWLWSLPDPDIHPSKSDSIAQGTGLVLALGLIAFQTSTMTGSSLKGVKIGDIRETEVLPEAARIRGDATAPIKIIEFADFNCPACRAAAPEIKDIYDKGRGKIQWAFRNIPLVKLQGHETSMYVATVSQLAAEKGLFWQFFDEAYRLENTERLKSLDGIKQVAMDTGLKAADIEASLNKDSSAAKAIYADLDLALRLNIQNTPTFLLIAPGVPPKAVVARRLKTLLQEQPYKGLIEAQ